jgi:response regulator NasT
LSRDLRIAVIDKNPLRAAVLEEGLRAAGHMSVVRIDDTADLLDRIHAIDPDVILIDLESPSRDVLEQMFKVSRSVARPVAMFVDQSDAAMIDAAIDAGVSAYIVDGLRKERVKPILDMTISRFNAFAKLNRELETAKSQLDDRKAIDRAKALVMRARAIPEEQAYALMRHVR